MEKKEKEGELQRRQEAARVRGWPATNLGRGVRDSYSKRKSEELRE